MTTYPNQKVIHINKNKYTANFLQVGIDEWQTAFKKLTPSAFAVYLYLASNADGFDLALSQKAIENALVDNRLCEAVLSVLSSVETGNGLNDNSERMIVSFVNSVDREQIADYLTYRINNYFSNASYQGQFFTPNSIARLAAKLMDVKDGDSIADFCSGTTCRRPDKK